MASKREARDLSKVKLRAEDLGELLGKFEIHFFGRPFFEGKKTINQEFFEEWRRECANFVTKNNAEDAHIDKEVEIFFEKHFALRVPKGCKITLSLCKEWDDLVDDFKNEVLKKRGTEK